jgi:hypothetical protein
MELLEKLAQPAAFSDDTVLCFGIGVRDSVLMLDGRDTKLSPG